ncbi:hypothetical protein Ga0074812_11539 [Parafrankia irregularis]|uniref:Uncharacterized protein n=1 Tax=Parafrankia irregularis TaxID=795642 RepID=A0A0S4QQR7_9ACTN|nr:MULTISPECIES: hypothetical protein [Parafrankia]MBE3202653.1 hypothetical protein [Parafrankia sp. CH37]CUU57837.1 hypothetical protein Ga0074812_11539 [Parafrankia irregularis]
MTPPGRTTAPPGTEPRHRDHTARSRRLLDSATARTFARPLVPATGGAS